MRLTYKFTLDRKDVPALLIKDFRTSNSIYNQSLYRQKEAHNKTGHWLSYEKLYPIIKVEPNLLGEINYAEMQAQVAQQTIRRVCSAINGYMKSHKSWKECPSKFKGEPKEPHYRKSGSEFLLEYPGQLMRIKDGILSFGTDRKITIPQWDKYKDRLLNFKAGRVIPKGKGKVAIEIIYECDAEVSPDLDPDRAASIDPGVGNLAALLMPDLRPILYSGRQLKSKNRLYNKRKGELQSDFEAMHPERKDDIHRPRCRSNAMKALTDHRDREIDDVMHKVSRDIVRRLIRDKVGTLIVGHNVGWKDSTDMGPKSNQNFVQIPHSRLMELLKYKCEMAGIRYIETNESHTSKCDALALEPICHHEAYMGRRTRRGLYVSSVGKALNADVNGAINIMRNVVGESPEVLRIIDSGLLFRPVCIRDLYDLKTAYKSLNGN